MTHRGLGSFGARRGGSGVVGLRLRPHGWSGLRLGGCCEQHDQERRHRRNRQTMHSQGCCSGSQMTVVPWLGSLHTATSGLEVSSFEMIVLGSRLATEASAPKVLPSDPLALRLSACASLIATCATWFPAPIRLRASGV